MMLGKKALFLDTQIFKPSFFSLSPCFSRRFYSNIYSNIIIKQGDSKQPSNDDQVLTRLCLVLKVPTILNQQVFDIKRRGFAKKGYTSLFLRQKGAHLKTYGQSTINVA